MLSQRTSVVRLCMYMCAPYAQQGDTGCYQSCCDFVSLAVILSACDTFCADSNSQHLLDTA